MPVYGLIARNLEPKWLQIQSNRDHKAVNRGGLGDVVACNLFLQVLCGLCHGWDLLGLVSLKIRLKLESQSATLGVQHVVGSNLNSYWLYSCIVNQLLATLGYRSLFLGYFPSIIGYFRVKSLLVGLLSIIHWLLWGAVAYASRLLPSSCGLLWGITAHHFVLVGFPGKMDVGEITNPAASNHEAEVRSQQCPELSLVWASVF